MGPIAISTNIVVRIRATIDTVIVFITRRTKTGNAPDPTGSAVVVVHGWRREGYTFLFT
jgi:hypothetical protein